MDEEKMEKTGERTRKKRKGDSPQGDPYVYSTSICPLYIHVSTPSLHVYPSFTYVIQFPTHGGFENENTFALAPSQRLLYS